MKRKYIKLTIITISILCLSLPSYGAFEMWGISVRARGMADAMSAVYGDINSVFHNPAGLSKIKSIQVMPNYTMPFMGGDDVGMSIMNAAVVVPFINDTFANWPRSLFGLLSFGLSNPLFMDGAYGFSFYNFSDELYYERAFSFTYSRELPNLLNTGMNFSIGVRFNLLMRGVVGNEYTEINPYFDNGLTSSGFGIDIGALFYLTPKFTIGVSMNNLLEPNIAINKNIATELVNRTLKYGLAWKIGDVVFMENLLVSYSLTSPGKDEGDIREPKSINHFGFEFWQFEHILGIRAGYEWGDELSNITFGLSYELALSDYEITVDYAFIFPTTMKATFGTHMFALVLKFNLSKSSFIFDEKKQAELKRIEDLKKKQKDDEDIK